MTSTLLGLANPAYLSSLSPDTQSPLEHQQRVLAEYLAHAHSGSTTAAADSDSDEGVLSDWTDSRAASPAHGPMPRVDYADSEGEGEEGEGEEAVDVDAVLGQRLGGTGWEAKGAAELGGAFMRLREQLYDAELRLASVVPYVPRWGPAQEGDGEGEGEDEDEDEDDTDAHLAGWLGRLTERDLEKATAQDMLGWMVDMCKALDGLEERLKTVM